jgi:hypothetical protein
MRHLNTHDLKTKRVLPAVFLILLLAGSCLKEMPEALPDSLVWNPEFAFPLGQDSFGLNAKSGFDTSLLEYDTLSGLPGWIEEDTIFLEGVMDFHLSSILNNLESTNQVLLRINIYNEFPHEVYSQAYFRDNGLNATDSLFTEGPVATGPGKVKAQAASITPGYTQKDVRFDRERLLSLATSTHMFFRAGFHVEDVDSSLIPYYRDFEYVVDVGAMVEIIAEY